MVPQVSTIGIRAIASKTTTTKFDVEKFDWKNFMLWKMRVMILLMKEGTHKAQLGAERSRPRWKTMSGWI